MINLEKKTEANVKMEGTILVLEKEKKALRTAIEKEQKMQERQGDEIDLLTTQIVRQERQRHHLDALLFVSSAEMEQALMGSNRKRS